MDLYQVIQFFASFFGWLEDQKVTLNHLGYVYIYIYGGLAVERKVLLADKITVNKSTDDGTAER